MSGVGRRLPAVHTLVAEARRRGLDQGIATADLTDAVRDTVARARRGGPVPADWMAAIGEHLAARTAPSLRPVINATGIILHTNLGRAPLAEAARRAMADAAGYATLEYDLDAGTRGQRQDHVRRLLGELTGADDALVVNNAAAALVLVLAALARGGETLVARGELVEIGGGFRLPDVMAESGTVLVEVGTTNRSRAADYTAAMTARTRAVLQVHRSNFRQTGFTATPTLDELAALCGPRAVPLIYDVGSGLLLDLSAFGLSGEPRVMDGVAAGAITIFSGDKLLGGPQAGVIVGPGRWLERLAHHPLARALRPEKTVLAALEATLRLYRDPDAARAAIPVLAMLSADPAALRRRARRLARRIPGAVVVAGHSEVGGGSFPGAELPTWLVSLSVPAPDTLVASLRRHDPPVIARVTEGRVVFDVRTVPDTAFAALAAAIP